jgi:hypothetical protein
MYDDDDDDDDDDDSDDKRVLSNISSVGRVAVYKTYVKRGILVENV